MTELAREAFEEGADWVVPVDADEFWHAPGGDLTKGARRHGGGGAPGPDSKLHPAAKPEGILSPRTDPHDQTDPDARRAAEPRPEPPWSQSKSPSWRKGTRKCDLPPDGRGRRSRRATIRSQEPTARECGTEEIVCLQRADALRGGPALVKRGSLREPRGRGGTQSKSGAKQAQGWSC